MAAALLRQLQSLAKGFKRPATSQAQARELQDAARRCCDSAKQLTKEDLAASVLQQEELTSKVLCVVQRLVAFDAALCHGADGSLASATPALLAQLRAACLAAEACAVLGCLLATVQQQSGNGAATQQLASQVMQLATLVARTGRASLERALETRALAQQRHDVDAARVAASQARQAAATQACALIFLKGLSGEAALPAEAAPLLVEWLLAAMEALQLGEAAVSGEPMTVASLAQWILGRASEVEPSADAGQREALLSAMLERYYDPLLEELLALGSSDGASASGNGGSDAAAGRGSSGSAGTESYSSEVYTAYSRMAEALSQPCLALAWRRRMQQHGAADAVEQVARIAARLPASPPPGVHAMDHAEAHALTLVLLGALCAAMLEPDDEPESPGTAAAAASSGGDSSSSSSGGDHDSSSSSSDRNSSGGSGHCSSSSSGGSGHCSSSSGAAPGISAEEGLAAGWVVVRALPALAASLRVAAASCAAAQTASACQHVLYALDVFLGAIRPGLGKGVVRSAQQAADWARAAEACLRLVPLLSELKYVWQQLEPDSPAAAEEEIDEEEADAYWMAAADLSAAAYECVYSWCCYDLRHWRPGAGDGAAASALRQLLRLGNTACRLGQWMAHNHRAEAIEEIDVDGWRISAQGLGNIVVAADRWRKGSDASRQQVAGLCLAFWAAVQAAAAVMPDPLGIWPDDVLCLAMEAAARRCPPLADAAFWALAKQLCAGTQEEPAKPANTPLAVFADLAYYGDLDDQPALAAGFCGCGLMLLLVEAAVRLECDEPGSKQADRYLDAFRNASSALRRAAAAAADELEQQAEGGSTASVQQAQQLRAACDALKAAHAEVDASLEAAGHSMPLEEEAQAWAPLLPLVADTAAALQQHLQQPEQVAAAALERARAATARSCSYLGCPQVHQAAKAKLCAACRTARYCCRACSVADWKAGHRAVCGALAAARAQQEEVEAAATAAPE